MYIIIIIILRRTHLSFMLIGLPYYLLMYFIRVIVGFFKIFCLFLNFIFHTDINKKERRKYILQQVQQYDIKLSYELIKSPSYLFMLPI